MSAIKNQTEEQSSHECCNDRGDVCCGDELVSLFYSFLVAIHLTLATKQQGSHVSSSTRRRGNSQSMKRPRGQDDAKGFEMSYELFLPLWQQVTSERLRVHVHAETLLLLYDVVAVSSRLFTVRVMEGKEVGAGQQQQHAVTLAIVVTSPAFLGTLRSGGAAAATAILDQKSKFEAEFSKRRDDVKLEDSGDEAPSRRVFVATEIILIARELTRRGAGCVPASDIMDNPQEHHSDLSQHISSSSSSSRSFVMAMTSSSMYGPCITALRSVPGQPARFASNDTEELPFFVKESVAVQTALRTLGVQLFEHQAQALRYIDSGHDAPGVIVTTPTASGKSMIYLLPLLHMLETTPNSTAVYLAPTKALEHDQFRAMTRFFECSGNATFATCLATFDGDTGAEARRAVTSSSSSSSSSRIIFTNPDMLHHTILPAAAAATTSSFWHTFLANLKYVILDEVHVYTGVFGIHVSHVMRRLNRLSSQQETQKANPLQKKFILLSATMANPAEHAAAVTQCSSSSCSCSSTCSCSFPVVSESTAPTVTRHLVLLKAERGVYSFVGNLLADLLEHNLRSLCFVKAKSLCEIVMEATRRCLVERGVGEDTLSALGTYRGGYTPADRRDIETKITTQQLRCVVCTNAMELGVDIGHLDAVVCFGYPGTVSSLWQQFGRCGRAASTASAADGLCFFVSMANPGDMALCNRGEAFFDRPVDPIKLNVGNEVIAQMHEDVSSLPKFGIRSIGNERFVVIDAATGSTLEELSGYVAYFKIYPGALFLHRGRKFFVETLDVAGGRAIARAVMSATYYTKTQDYTSARQMHSAKETSLSLSCRAHEGPCEIVLKIYGFHKISTRTHRVIDTITLPSQLIPDHVVKTRGVWFTVPDTFSALSNLLLTATTKTSIRTMNTPEHVSPILLGLHGLLHIVLDTIPVFVNVASSRDFGGATRHDKASHHCYFIIYDSVPGGGAGISDMLFPIFRDILMTTQKTLQSCSCDDGCEMCVFSSSCGCHNAAISRKLTLIVLSAIML
eukprot:PhM_4_TR19132/c0_g1_i1/m.15421/K06877/K06877; DEAD/DEAH box helicase domain-containing protein